MARGFNTRPPCKTAGPQLATPVFGNNARYAHPLNHQTSAPNACEYEKKAVFEVSLPTRGVEKATPVETRITPVEGQPGKQRRENGPCIKDVWPSVDLK